MKHINTLVVNGEAYVLQDKNAVTAEMLEEKLGDVEAALETLHNYALSLGGEGA